MRSLFTLFIILITGLGSIAQVEKTVIVEHFTNTRCGVCASKNPGLFSLLDNYPQVLHIAFHPSSPYSSCIFSQHNPAENDARTNFYGIYGGTPRVVLNGNVIGIQSPLLTSDQLDAALGQTSDFDLRVSHEQTDNDEVQVQIVVKKVSESLVQSPLIFAMIAEKEIDYAAPNGETLHHDVFRKLLIDENFTISDVGDSIVLTDSYNIHNDWDEEELIVFAIIQNESNNEVLQAAESDKLDAGSSAVSEGEALSLDGQLYPNPATDVVNLSPKPGQSFVSAEMYSLNGVKLKSYTNPVVMDISELPEGVYMLVATDDRNRKYHSRIVKR